MHGYVILYSASNVTHLIEQRTLNMSLLNFPNKGHLYTIRVFAYKDLPSMLFDAGNIYFAGTRIILYMYMCTDCPIMPSLINCMVQFPISIVSPCCLFLPCTFRGLHQMQREHLYHSIS